jgi:hypothetical protein
MRILEWAGIVAVAWTAAAVLAGPPVGRWLRGRPDPGRHALVIAGAVEAHALAAASAVQAVGSMILAEEMAISPAGFLRGFDDVLSAGTVTNGWQRCSDPPEESCSDAACPVHGCPDDAPWSVTTSLQFGELSPEHQQEVRGMLEPPEPEGWTPELLAELGSGQAERLGEPWLVRCWQDVASLARLRQETAGWINDPEFTLMPWEQAGVIA